ncbi:SDR family NAD(P)-dependent oxidoreductase [Protaetiibacter sp. SSC-01]|uniref:SDR family NAD(P)-dependent oxidoreductase n=1 Tax=Protaetiibacter sp. SSC-01 TaxID=2759943 RepID=UPI001656ABC4|nr:SDR family NAD(P)-dependent oxidoreductase [Protaetiibacter sp. SSC-01]QNO37590.1 SDR family NAD(P)-dependent oxidoreductase [Protaetiibacter sp. SSC-01]
MTAPADWDPRALPRLDGRTVVVTGGNAGIGYFVSEQLASAGARVVIAARSAEKARLAIDSIRSRFPEAELAHVPLDLTSLASVRAASERIAEFRPLHALVNNAGRVVASRRRLETEDGFELTVGGNFLGHFALTTLLFPALAADGRVVGLGSDSTRMVRLEPTKLWSEHRYGAFRAYAYSKHAVTGFQLELARRLAAAGDTRRSLLAHPGWATSAYAARRPGITDRDPWRGRFFETLTGWVGQGKDRGAWPVVRAVADPDAANGSYFGPRWELAGRPVPTRPVASAASREFGAWLWGDAEVKTGIRFPL